MATKIYGRGNTYASLVSLTTNNSNFNDPSFSSQDDNGQRVIINFPAMPETLELSRVANYETLQSAIAPDGLHFYKWTDPMKIPLKFSLSCHDDDYCNGDGPYALLRIAANLHALTMPIVYGNQTSVVGLNAAPKTGTQYLTSGASGGTSGQAPDQANAASGSASQTNNSSNYVDFYFPPACLLSISLAANVSSQSTLGVFCVGFVERVNTVLRGPWLQGDFGNSAFGGTQGQLRNLPSFIDCEFTFVNQPGYTNDFKGYVDKSGKSKLRTTTSSDVYKNFYNTQAYSQFTVPSTAAGLAPSSP